MTTPVAPQDLWSYCNVLQSEIQCLHDRLDRLEHGDAAASTTQGHPWRLAWDGTHWTSHPPTPAPTPAVIAVGHTSIPLADTLPTAADSPDRYVCTLVVPDVVVGHIVGRGGKGLHQAHDVSGAQLRAYTDKASPAERRVSIRGTDQQVGEVLIALGKCFMRKRVRAKKKGPSCPSEDPAPPPAGPVPAPPRAAMDVDPPPRHQTHPPAPGRLAQDLHPHDDGGLRPATVGAQGPLTGRVRFAPQQSPPPPLQPLPREPATTAPIAPTQVMAPPTSTLRPNSTPFVPSVTMSTPLPTGGPPTAYRSPMLIDTVATGRRRRCTQTAQRGGAIPAHSARVVGNNIYFPGDPEY
ncbi:hypothetical protein B0H14DRAFT_3507089 [Mycena olivaceomarginata]|nr:hypothetical protein B0H14DRAFT_3507089 [Mycena olivaceomarginata]